MIGSTTDKIKGAANQAIGKAKQGIGEAIDSPKLQGEGAIQEARAMARRLSAMSRRPPRKPLTRPPNSRTRSSERFDVLKDRPSGRSFCFSYIHSRIVS